ncbi:phosphatase PAP2 family protein [Halovivax gelatinilyticus]|uniref:phosphatase PAP2 family protein n=1 Tax=Halovivax gelatinilyticus TaxID=2961597 RepID=UPI0020CA74AF|nr:phosphatase PAP2 family protein [Halovivax gelatinilyticus]
MWFDSTTVRTVRDTFPEWAAFLWALFSYVGSVWFVAPAIVIAFYFGPRDRFAPWLGTVMGAYAIMVGTKGYFEIGRPGVGPAIAPETLPVGIRHAYAPLVEVSSTSFPSGHAMAGTAIWLAFAFELDVGTRRQRLVGASAMIAAIGFSRVAVGLHYPIDVFVGAAIAAAFVAAVIALRRTVRTEYDRHAETTAVFVAVAAVSLVSFVVGGRVDAAALFGGAVGSAIAWTYATPPYSGWALSIDRVGHGLLGIGLLSAGAAVLLVTDWVVVWFGLGLFAGVVIVGLPRLVAVTIETEESSLGVSN